MFIYDIMCWPQKCCFKLSLDVGGVVLGVFVLVMAAACCATAGALLAGAGTGALQLRPRLSVSNSAAAGAADLPHKPPTHSNSTLHLNMEQKGFFVIFTVILIMSLLGVIFSSLFLYGLRKNVPGLVVSFFGYCTTLAIMLVLGALLQLLASCWHWAIPVAQLVVAAFLLHGLFAVYEIYDLMLKGKRFGHNRHDILCEELLSTA